MTRRKFIFGALYSLSFIFLIIHLNFNVRTFRLTQDLQDITLQIYDLSFDVQEKELDYLYRTNLEHIYDYVTNDNDLYLDYLEFNGVKKNIAKLIHDISLHKNNFTLNLLNAMLLMNLPNIQNHSLFLTSMPHQP